MLTNVDVYLIILINFISGQEEAGSPCNFTLTGQEGICVYIDQCPQARDDIKHKRLLQPCSLQGNVIIVCCLNNVTSTSTSPSPSVTTEASISTTSRVPGVISKQKCREYSKHVFVKRAPVLIVDIDRYMKNICDFRINLRNTSGPITARTNEFPHMALVGFETQSGDIQWLCGGSLISEQYVLTAAHCMLTREYGAPTYIKVGITNRRQDTRHLQYFKIIDVIQHPDYKISSVYNDIGLLKLEKPIEITPYAEPACLYTEHNITTYLGVVSGWGRMTYNSDFNDNLHKITTKFVNTKECNKTYSMNRKLKNGVTDVNMLCAIPTSNSGVCQGDSGGPLQIYHSGDDVECMYDIVGIVSFGKTCDSDQPGIYTRVSNYVKWIEDIIWP